MSGQATNNAGGVGIGKWLAAGAVVIAVAGVLVYTGTQSQVAAVRTADVKYMAANKSKPGVITTASGLQYQVIRAGQGPKPAAKDTVLACHSCRYLEASYSTRFI